MPEYIKGLKGLQEQQAAAGGEGAAGRMKRYTDNGGLCWGLKGDFSHLGWVEAYDSATAAIARHYAYTTHRRIDWAAAIARYRPAVLDATAVVDRAAYYMALKDLIGETKDGHCSVEPHSEEMEAVVEKLRTEQVGGGFGAAFSRAEAGEVVVSCLLSESTGLAVGDVVDSVNGEPIEEYLVGAVSLRWCDPVPATTAHRDSERLRLLSRAPPGTAIRLGVKGKSEFCLTSDESEQLSHQMQTMHCTEDFKNADLSHHVEGGIGCLTLTHFEHEGALLAGVREAMASFEAAAVCGVILDLRGNGGGSDAEPPELMGFFMPSDSEALLVEQDCVVKATAEVFAAEGENMIDFGHPEGMMLWDNRAYCLAGGEAHPSYARPHTEERRWLGPLAVLVNRCTLSNGDMVSMLARKLGAAIVGFEGTSACVSLSDGCVLMPEMEICFTLGQSLDSENNIQLECGSSGIGGVLPDAPIKGSIDNLHSRMMWLLKQASGGEREPSAVDFELQQAKSVIQAWPEDGKRPRASRWEGQRA